MRRRIVAATLSCLAAASVALLQGPDPGRALATASSKADAVASAPSVAPAVPAAAPAVLPAVHVAGAQHAGAVDQSYDLAGLPESSAPMLPALLDAYQVAVLAAPTLCHLDASLLAAIGQVESDNLAGMTVDADHVVQPHVVGRALDGRGAARVQDTDGGALDSDTRWDRGIGPLKLLPSAWEVAAVDLGGDGKRDPQNVYDSAGAAMVHLCAGGADLATSQGLRDSLLQFKPSRTWVRLVLAWQDLYAAAGIDDYWGLWNWAAPPTDLTVPASLTEAAPASDPHAANMEAVKEARPVLTAPAPSPVASVPSPSAHPTAATPGSSEEPGGSAPRSCEPVSFARPSDECSSPYVSRHPDSTGRADAARRADAAHQANVSGAA